MIFLREDRGIYEVINKKQIKIEPFGKRGL